MEPDPLRELERQVERGHVFAHAVLAQHANRAGENEAIIRGLVELLIEREVVAARRARRGGRRGPHADQHRASTSPSGSTPRRRTDGAPVDCAARLHVCHAVCCRLRFPLTVEEVESGGPLKWDLGRPYFNRHGAGRLLPPVRARDARLPASTRSGPQPCRQYSCVGDERIWKDFDAMELNQEWIDEHARAPGPGRSRSS